MRRPRADRRRGIDAQRTQDVASHANKTVSLLGDACAPAQPQKNIQSLHRRKNAVEKTAGRVRVDKTRD
jgi:hypothetical protein